MSMNCYPLDSTLCSLALHGWSGIILSSWLGSSWENWSHRAPWSLYPDHLFFQYIYWWGHSSAWTTFCEYFCNNDIATNKKKQDQKKKKKIVWTIICSHFENELLQLLKSWKWWIFQMEVISAKCYRHNVWERFSQITQCIHAQCIYFLYSRLSI